MLDIIIIANFCGDFSNLGNGRFEYLANILSKEHHVEIITGDFFHEKKAYIEKNKITKKFCHKGQ